MIGNSLSLKWTLLQSDTVQMEFWYPPDIPQIKARVYQGIQHNYIILGMLVVNKNLYVLI